MLATLLQAGNQLIHFGDHVRQARIGRQRLHRAAAAAGDDLQRLFHRLVKTASRLLTARHLGNGGLFHSAFNPVIDSANLTDFTRSVPVRPTATLSVRNPAGSLNAD